MSLWGDADGSIGDFLFNSFYSETQSDTHFYLQRVHNFAASMWPDGPALPDGLMEGIHPFLARWPGAAR